MRILVRLFINASFIECVFLFGSKLGLTLQLGLWPCFAGQERDCAGCLADSLNASFTNAPFHASFFHASFII